MRNARRAMLCGLSLAAMMTATAAFAADDDNTVQELVITGGLEETLPSELAKGGHDLVVVTDATLRQKSYVDLGNALQMEIPGLYLSQQAGPFSYAYVSLQGSRAQDVLWTVDGIRINNRLYASTSPNDTLPASMVERVEVLKGGEGLYYGTQAVAGVINFVTRGFSDKTGGEISLGGDTNDSYHADGYVRGAAGPHRFVAFASKDRSDGFSAFDVYQPSGTDHERGYDVTNYGLKYGLSFAENLRLSATWLHTDADLDYPNSYRVAFAQNSRDEDVVGLKVDYDPDEGLQFFLKGYYHDWDSHYTTLENNPANLSAPPTVTDDNLYWGFQDQGINALARLPAGGFDYLLGYDYQSYKARDEVLIIENVAEDVNAIFGQIRTNKDLSERFNAGIGVRYNKTGGSEATVWNVDGRVYLNDAVFLQGNFGTTFTLPTAENLFAVDPFSTFGNPDLKPEEGENYNASIGGHAGKFEWLVTGFHRKIKNLITFFDNDIDPLTGAYIPSPLVPDAIENHPDYSGEVYINAGDAKFSGFELIGAVQLTDALRVNASYTQNEARSAGSNVQMGRIPESLAKASVEWQPMGAPYGGAVTALWTGDVFQGAINYGDYYVVDLTGFLYLDEAHKHRLTARLANAFDEEYATRVTTSGRVDNSTARYTFRNLGQPRTFSIRYSYAFGD